MRLLPRKDTALRELDRLFSLVSRFLGREAEEDEAEALRAAGWGEESAKSGSAGGRKARHSKRRRCVAAACAFFTAAALTPCTANKEGAAPANPHARNPKPWGSYP